MGKTIKDVMHAQPTTLDKGATAMQAAHLMRERGIGAVLVVEEEGALCGLITDRDLVLRVMADGRDPDTTVLGEVCTANPEQLEPSEDADEAIRRMAQRAIRRLPVTEGGKPIGIVTLGDLAIDRDPKSLVGTISAAPAQS